jgi:hypothetical protein
MLCIEPEFHAALAAVGLESTDAICRKFLPPTPPLKTGVQVKPVGLDSPGRKPLELFFKLYTYQPPSWLFFGRASKARCEFRNYAVFTRLGIRCARRVACGEERDALGRLRRAFILTEAIPDAVTLVEFFQNVAERLRPGAHQLRQAVIRQLAEMTRRAHGAGFFHHDLVWRNVLVTHAPPDEPRLWWIDCPRGRFDHWSPWRERRRVKDLASLDKVASQLATRLERVLFVKHYLGLSRLDAGAKSLIRHALTYRKQRWPDDWR